MSEFSKRDMRMFDAAQKASDDSDFKVHVGAVIAKGNVIAASGHSTEKTSPIQAHYNRQRRFEDTGQLIQHKMHAEIQALSKLKNIDLHGMSIYVYRETADKNPALARPCEACMSALRDAGIKNIYYTGENSYVYERLGAML